MPEFSYNGWLASPNPADFGGLAKLVVAGESFAPGVRAGEVHAAFQWLVEQLHARVEPVVKADWHQADDWGYSYRQNRNANNLSCHASATAIDYNATRHPNGKRGTFTPAQVAQIRRILAEADGIFQWGGDYTGTADEMHFEVIRNAAAVAAFVRKISPPQEDDDMKEADFQRIQAIVDDAVANRELGTVDGKKVYWWQVALQQFRDAGAVAAIRADIAAIKAKLDEKTP